MVSLTFAGAAIVTGLQAIMDPIGFSHSFGLPITLANDTDKSKFTAISPSSKPNGSPIKSYISLMGVRQLATGITLLTFAYQQKWTEMATILAILGIVVAGTDGIYLSRAGARNLAKFHAIPGALIALLACATILTDA
ncbi:hypothetical protein H2200_010969 [Cladophialophora chaetospira]|uniref:DUF4267 domain-containing protein n=1 Tax=Cladophialophora chaetospira TaxID=386627 RepID=A0AA38X138_9EURO|nr:hypothetical protein H2200_010969 [Cladophialophora chaetospira]